MKKSSQRFGLVLLAASTIFYSSCKKDIPSNNLSIGNFTDTTGALKSFTSSSFPNVGMAVTYSSMASNPTFLATVKREVNNVTFGNELKEGSIVQNDGTYNYTTADALYNICANNGIGVFGHNLVWYSQQNATYLNGLISKLVTPGTGGTPAPNLLAGLNGDFETGSGNSFTNWNNIAGGVSSATFTAVAGNNSARALQANVTTPGVNAYDVQSIGPTFNVKPGNTINFSVDIKTSNTSGKVRVVVQNVDYAQYDVLTTTTGWTTYTFSITVNEATPIIRFNFPVAGTYTIDNLVITDPTQAVPAVGAKQPTTAQIAAVIQPEMVRYITTTMQRYNGKINAWDVVNEPLLDNGAVRTNTNFTITAPTSQFLYGQYLGTSYNNSYITAAFKAARAAVPSATLFINDYNLEYATVKTDSMVAMVTALNKYGATIDGIGTQMHISLGANLANIDYMFKRLASTGLKIRISEMDIVINGLKTNPFKPTATLLAYQAAMYKYVIQSYIRNVPAPQRYGVTVWGVSDTDSWLNTATSPDAPLLFNASYGKKPAYAGFKQGVTN
jgi:endo-1,4-beta-xylanase